MVTVEQAGAGTVSIQTNEMDIDVEIKDRPLNHQQATEKSSKIDVEDYKEP